jgi:hypothetical protein
MEYERMLKAGRNPNGAIVSREDSPQDWAGLGAGVY